MTNTIDEIRTRFASIPHTPERDMRLNAELDRLFGPAAEAHAPGLARQSAAPHDQIMHAALHNSTVRGLLMAYADGKLEYVEALERMVIRLVESNGIAFKRWAAETSASPLSRGRGRPSSVGHYAPTLADQVIAKMESGREYSTGELCDLMGIGADKRLRGNMAALLGSMKGGRLRQRLTKGLRALWSLR